MSGFCHLLPIIAGAQSLFNLYSDPVEFCSLSSRFPVNDEDIICVVPSFFYFKLLPLYNVTQISFCFLSYIFSFIIFPRLKIIFTCYIFIFVLFLIRIRTPMPQFVTYKVDVPFQSATILALSPFSLMDAEALDATLTEASRC